MARTNLTKRDAGRLIVGYIEQAGQCTPEQIYDALDLRKREYEDGMHWALTRRSIRQTVDSPYNAPVYELMPDHYR